MNYRKSELAELQLDEAIRQFIDRRNFVCAATLAGAAEAIFGALLERENIPGSLDRLYDGWVQDKNLAELSRKQFRDMLNLARNQLKHAGDPAYDELTITELEPMLLIARAAGMHHKFAAEPTAELVRFREWWIKHAKSLINGFPDPGLQKSKPLSS
jgi:hypothetical protein